MKEKIEQFQEYFLSKKPKYLTVAAKKNQDIIDKKFIKRKSYYPILSDLSTIIIKKFHGK